MIVFRISLDRHCLQRHENFLHTQEYLYERLTYCNQTGMPSDDYKLLENPSQGTRYSMLLEEVL